VGIDGGGWQAAAMDRLAALRIKYARAQEHHEAWSRALDRWVSTMPYGVRGEADSSGWFVIRLVARELPPPELARSATSWNRLAR
jgi:hypothetical protein